MSLYALDTDTLSLWQHAHSAVSQHVAAHRFDELAVTVISVQEQLDGWHARLPRARTPKRTADLYRRLAETVRFLSSVEILHYTEAAIQRFTQLRKQCPNVGRMDLRIAAIALEHGAILVTRNRTDFLIFSASLDCTSRIGLSEPERLGAARVMRGCGPGPSNLPLTIPATISYHVVLTPRRSPS